MEKIKPLSDQEVKELDVSAMLRKMGELDKVLFKLNIELAESEREYGEARIRLEILKTQKSVIVERCRNLKALVSNA